MAEYQQTKSHDAICCTSLGKYDPRPCFLCYLCFSVTKTTKRNKGRTGWEGEVCRRGYWGLRGAGWVCSYALFRNELESPGTRCVCVLFAD